MNIKTEELVVGDVVLINKLFFHYEANAITFPTEEMRDAFHENFKDLIESCKELL